MPRRMRSRSQYYSAKPMSKQMRSRCQDVRMNAKPMSPWGEAYVKVNAKPMSRRMRSRCQGDRDADVEKTFTSGNTQSAKPMPRRMRSRCQYYSAEPMSRRPRSRCREGTHSHTPNGSTDAHKQFGAKWKHVVRFVLSMVALINSLPSTSLAQYSFIN